MRPLSLVEAQWIFNNSAPENTPSRDDGITLEDELKRRREAVNHIRSIAIRAKICDHQDPLHLQARGVLTVAATLLHRFYMRRSLADFKEKYVAATMLFLASKIEEEPLKLRYIVNACLGKWDIHALQWDPHSDKGLQQPGLEYQRWERNILATEEIVLDALCFDMTVEQPMIVLRRSIQGLDELLRSNGQGAESSRTAEERAKVNGGVNGHNHVNGKGKGKLSEELIVQLGWTIVNEAHLTPLPILYHPYIFAFGIFTLTIALIEQITLDDAYAAASELGEPFGLDIRFDEEKGAVGSDTADVRSFVAQFCEYCAMEYIDRALLDLLVTPGPDPAVRSFRRRFTRMSPQADQTVPEEDVSMLEQVQSAPTPEERMSPGDDLFGEEPSATDRMNGIPTG